MINQHGIVAYDKPPLSIVIPTRNRPECAISAIRVALAATEHSEVIVADSSDTDKLRSMIASLGDIPSSRLRYFVTETTLNVVENFELALEWANGDYVIFIGDDDFVGPYIEEFAIKANIKGIDALVPYGKRFGVAYYWPGVKSRYFGDAYSARLFIWSNSGKTDKVITSDQMIQVQNNVGLGLLYMPRIYHGMVKRSLLKNVKSVYGHIFGGISPDIYSSVLINSIAKNVYFVDFPFCVPGASPVSEAGSGAARTDRLSFADSPYLQRFKNLTWDDRIPRFFSPFTGWGFSLVKGMETIGEQVPTRTFCKIYARCLLFARRHWRETFAAMSALQGGRRADMVRLLTLLHIFAEISRLSWHAIRRLGAYRAGGRAERFGPLPSTWEAYKLLQTKLSRPTEFLDF